MDEFIKKMVEKGLIDVVKKLIQQQEIQNYTKPFTKPDNYAEWIRLYQRN